MIKKVKDLVIGDCFKSFLTPGANTIVAEKCPTDLPIEWAWGKPLGKKYLEHLEREVELVPSYRTFESQIQTVTFKHVLAHILVSYPQVGTTPGQIFSQMVPMPPKKETFDGLTAAECLVIYQAGMQTERIRTNKQGQKFIVPAWGTAAGIHLNPPTSISDPEAGLNPTQFIAAQVEFTRIIREKAAKAKRIKTENETVLVQRDTDYFNE